MELKYQNVLVTGAAGFIGYHLAERLLENGCRVVGLDNLNPYYDVALKEARLEQLQKKPNFTCVQMDLAEHKQLLDLFARSGFDVVVNLAAQAGVRYSLENPHAYVDSNLVGFVNLLECCRHHALQHLVFASSSSVYGANTAMPFSVHHNVDHPISLYAATKKANELMAHTYSHLYQLPCTGLRFFTVYGPWGRPDMALFLFTRAILENKPIQVFNHGKMQRDFTYIDDIIEGVIRVMGRLPAANPDWSGDVPDPGTSYAPYKIYNIGNNNPVELIKFIEVIETALGKQATKQFMEIQPG
ncbi:MAG: NAD-dependent epimerase, partial [Deltaproteobacteria bacterium]|nr:NAD-dependent epimerase [Deltaproteobacteria bacterium]